MLGIVFGLLLARAATIAVGAIMSSSMNGVTFSATPSLSDVAISFGVSVGIGGHNEEHKQKGDAQFEISDPRSLQEIHEAILAQGMQPVYTDYINTNIL